MNTLAQERNVIPTDVSLQQDHDRYHHVDIPSLTDDQIRAEQWVLTSYWSVQVFHGRQPRLFHFAEAFDLVWVRERIDRLKAEEGRRRQRTVRRIA